MFNILNIYETFDKKNKKKHEDRKSGELDEKTKEKQHSLVELTNVALKEK